MKTLCELNLQWKCFVILENLRSIGEFFRTGSYYKIEIIKIGQILRVHTLYYTCIWQCVLYCAIILHPIFSKWNDFLHIYREPLHQTFQDLISSFYQHNAELKLTLSDRNHNDLVLTTAELPANITCALSLLKPTRESCTCHYRGIEYWK